MCDNEEMAAALVRRAQMGEITAFAALVRRFQDRAVAYGASILGDFALAEDAAQEAFLEAYQCLPALREPAAFAGWLRKIVFKQCDRLTRGKHVRTLPIEAATDVAAPQPGPAEIAESRQRQARVREAVQSLPPGERAAVTLFYMGTYSQREVAEFLGVPASTVKNRLHSARARLKERMMAMLEDDLREARPSKDDAFVARVQENITLSLAALEAGESEILPGDTQPNYHLVASLIVWAIARGASEIHIVPDGERVAIRFDVGGVLEEAVALPKSLQQPVSDRIKTMAYIPGTEQPMCRRRGQQEGLLPVLHKETRYDMPVSCIPTDHGEKIVVRILRVDPAPD